MTSQGLTQLEPRGLRIYAAAVVCSLVRKPEQSDPVLPCTYEMVMFPEHLRTVLVCTEIPYRALLSPRIRDPDIRVEPVNDTDRISLPIACPLYGSGEKDDGLQTQVPGKDSKGNRVA